jgi:CheY-like chemotaxis protein
MEEEPKIKKKIIVATAQGHFSGKDKNILDRTDLVIFHALSGTDVLSIHKAEKADLIIMDIDLPVISADKVCAMIRDDDALRKVSIALLCNNNKSDIGRCIESKANAYFIRPLDPVLFDDKISQLLDIAERKTCRILIRIEVKCEMGTSSFFCSSKDLSVSGILLETDKPLVKGDVLTCSFFLPNSVRIVTEGKVVRVQRRTVRTFFYGIEFIALQPEYKEIIETFIKNLGK